MKLRIQGDSLRLRLKRHEVEAVGRDGRVEDSIRFAGGTRFTYAVAADRSIEDIAVDYAGDTITVRLPASPLAEWVESDRVGFEREIVTNGGTLHVLVEKDFACIHRETGVEAGSYPNPLAAAD